MEQPGFDHLRKWLETASICISVLAIAAAVWYSVWMTQRGAERHLVPLTQSADGTVTRVNAFLDFVNRPCDVRAVRGQLLKDGPLCQLQKLETEMRGIAVDSRSQVRQTGTLLDAAVSGMTTVTGKLGEEVVALKGTTDAATNLLDTTNIAVGQLSDKNNGVLAVLTTYNQTGKNINSILVDKATRRMLDNFAATSDSISVTSNNLALVTSDFQTRFHAVLYPPKCKTVGCRIGHGLATGLKEGPAFGQSLYWTYRLFDETIPVKLIP